VSEVPAILHDASGLVATVERAKALLDEGDVIAAKVLAARAYDDAKNAIRLAKRFNAAYSLIAKARRLQADALLIETQAKIQIVDQWDAAKKEGLAGNGRPGSGRTILAADTGLRSNEIHYARKLRDIENKTPGAIKALISSKVDEGLSPTKSMLHELHCSDEWRKHWPVSAAGFSRRLYVELDSAKTTHNQLGAMIARVQHMARFLKAVQAHGVPIGPNGPLKNMISAARFDALWEETK
jgi:hypothetical protein